MMIKINRLENKKTFSTIYEKNFSFQTCQDIYSEIFFVEVENNFFLNVGVLFAHGL